MVEQVLICLIAGGHVLLEDVPGVGKTTLAGVLARSIAGSFGRIQCTPDTLPGDIIGISVYNMQTGSFEYRPGAVMHQILLADEVNRTSPKTQASLLEAMEEGQVTVDGTVYPLQEPFMVLATQNPVEYIGTYPLPEAQLDRFMMRLSIGYPSREQEIRMAQQFLQGEVPSEARAVCEIEELLQVKKAVRQVLVKESVLEYIENIITATREEANFTLGISARGMLSLIAATQGRAYLHKRDFVKPDDVKAVAAEVLSHRVILSAEARLRKVNARSIIKGLVAEAKVPV